MGARIGDGKEWMSWIHIDDLIAVMLRLLRDEQMHGPYNATSPQPVTNAEFTRELASALRRPALFVAPPALLKLSMGESASLVLEGQRVLPKRLESAHYRFRFPELRGALENLLN
jgi:hypothetical protein